MPTYWLDVRTSAKHANEQRVIPNQKLLIIFELLFHHDRHRTLRTTCWLSNAMQDYSCSYTLCIWLFESVYTIQYRQSEVSCIHIQYVQSWGVRRTASRPLNTIVLPVRPKTEPKTYIRTNASRTFCRYIYVDSLSVLLYAIPCGGHIV